MKNELDLSSLRARKARLSLHIGKFGFRLLVILIWLFGLAAVYFFWADEGTSHGGYIFLSLTLLCFVLALWDKWDLQRISPLPRPDSLDDILEARLLARLKKAKDISPKAAWTVAVQEWQARFLLNHLLLDARSITQILSDNSEEMPVVWQKAVDLTSQSGSKELDSGALAAALLISSDDNIKHLSKLNLKEQDIIDVFTWLQRFSQAINKPKPHFGGIGRDWAAGFTPLLDRFGMNISREVEARRGHFHTLAHADVLDTIIHNLNSGSVGLVGEAGSGKTSIVYALAQRLLEGREENLKYYQIISLDASAIMSQAKQRLEDIILNLLGEAVHARNVIIFLDDAELFFGSGTGAFDLSNILMPLLGNRSIKLIAAFTPDDYQQLKSRNGELAAHLPTVVISEPSPEIVKQILEDSALTLEAGNNIVVSHQAVQEAYKLSAQYMQELAYPGKAISLLDQALPYVKDKFMDAESVQSAVEKTRGVKVSKAEAPEADTLLHLEDKIHVRMVNQDRAVKVVAGALRRGRAGVADPKRPIGSFLFLGPTGVGKTELARSLAATYFGSEKQMIRLDMTEYQQADDVARLLQSGGNAGKSFILQIREQPFSVVLLDEIEKAHPNILNLLLQLLDEGQLTDEKGHAASFKNAIIITTSNAGAVEITQKVEAGDSLESFEKPLIDKLINDGQFKPELINRFDEIVLFRPLNKSELTQVAAIMLAEVNKTLAAQSISVKLTDAALQKVVETGYDPEFGARPMRRALQKLVEDAVAKKVLSNEAQPGSEITLDVNDLAS